jgi:hypothetical protein
MKLAMKPAMALNNAPAKMPLIDMDDIAPPR